MANGSTLTKYTSAVTIVTADTANSLYGGLYGSPEASALAADDCRVIGHIHDGQHLDGHAGKIDLVDHVSNQIRNINIADDSITPRNIRSFIDQNDAIPVSENINGTDYYFLNIPAGGGGGLSITGTDNRLVRMDGANGIQDSLIIVSNFGEILPVANGQRIGDDTSRFGEIFLDSGARIGFDNAGIISTKVGDLTLDVDTAVNLEISGNQWLSLDGDEGAIKFAGTGYSNHFISSDVDFSIFSPNIALSATDVEIISTNDISISNTAGLWLTLDESKSLISFSGPGLSADAGIVSMTDFSITAVGSLTVKGLNLSDEEFVFTDSESLLPEDANIRWAGANAPNIEAISLGDLSISTFAGDLFINSSGSFEVASAATFIAADTSIELNANSITINSDSSIRNIMGSAATAEIIFEATGFGQYAKFATDSFSAGDYTLVLAGSNTDTYNPSSAPRIYTQTAGENSVRMIETGNNTSFQMQYLNMENLAAPTTSQRFLEFRGNGSVLGYISGDGAGDIVYQTFTGGHRGLLADKNDPREYKFGMILCSTGETTYDNACKVTLASKDGDPKVMGAYCGRRTVDGSETKYPVGEIEVHYIALGDSRVLVTNKNGNIQAGDLIESSSVTGYGQLQSDSLFKSSTVAKCTQDIDWDSIEDTVSGYKFALVSCTYHCG